MFTPLCHWRHPNKKKVQLKMMFSTQTAHVHFWSLVIVIVFSSQTNRILPKLKKIISPGAFYPLRTFQTSTESHLQVHVILNSQRKISLFGPGFTELSYHPVSKLNFTVVIKYLAPYIRISRHFMLGLTLGLIFLPCVVRATPGMCSMKS